MPHEIAMDALVESQLFAISEGAVVEESGKDDMNTTPILLVEDSEDNIFLVEHAMHKAGITDPLQIAKSGEQAIEYLSGTKRYSDWLQFPLPSIVLLDLKMPGMSGFDVLKWISSLGSNRYASRC